MSQCLRIPPPVLLLDILLPRLARLRPQVHLWVSSGKFGRVLHASFSALLNTKYPAYHLPPPTTYHTYHPHLPQYYSPLLFLSMPTCSGSSKSPGMPCVCASFVPRSPPKENKCDICGHRRSAHTDNTTSNTGKYVNRLLKNIAVTAVHEEARKETIQGFRPRQPSNTTTATAMSIQKGKGKNTRRTSTRITSSQSSGNVKIGRIIIFPCGVEVLSIC